MFNPIVVTVAARTPNAPYLLDRARAGQRLGHGRMLEHMFHDGLEDAYDRC